MTLHSAIYHKIKNNLHKQKTKADKTLTFVFLIFGFVCGKIGLATR